MKDACYQSGLLPIEDALKKITRSLEAVKGMEKRPLKKALGRVLASPVHSSINIPPERNAAMDGYAFAGIDIKEGEKFSLKQVGISWAGKPFADNLKAGECVRIFTGAVMPENADSVIMQERVQVEHGRVHFPAGCRFREYVRYTGEDMRKGGCLLEAGKRLNAPSLGLLAAAGVHSVEVQRRLRIGYFSTGDELVAIGQGLQTGQIYDSNRYLLHGLLDDPAFAVDDLGVVTDDKDALKRMLEQAAADYDVLISTGGASVGEADHVQAVLDELGEVCFWKIAMKPGKPVAFGHIGSCAFFGLPGNPASVMVTYDVIVKPALRVLSGLDAIKPLQVRAVSDSVLRKEAGRQEYLRGILRQQFDGTFVVTSAGRQGSNILSAASRANCYIVLPHYYTDVQAGEEVMVEPFDNFI